MSLSAAARSAAADKLTPKKRPKRNRSNGKIKPRKGVRADPLADRLFLSRWAGFRCRAAACFCSMFRPFPFGIVDNSEKFFNFS